MKQELRALFRGIADDKLTTIYSANERAEQLLSEGDPCASIFFLRNFTIETIEPLQKFALHRRGLRAKIGFGNYDAMVEELSSASSALQTSGADMVVLSLFLEHFAPDAASFDWDAEACWERLRQLYDFAESSVQKGLIVVNTFIPPLWSEYGIAAAPAPMISRQEKIAQLNRQIYTYVQEHRSRFAVVDWECLARIAGEEQTYDYRYRYMSKAPFKQTFMSLYAAEIAKMAAALKGKAKKCLVLDCDNTLWGGIVGEDGLDGIKLDPYDYPGNVFHAVHKTLVDLANRGVLLLLCSKNNEADVWEVFDKHPHCLLKREHIAAWRINWQDKASNIASLALDLNLGLDSFVFLDDNPVECGLVEQTLPDVMVVQVPERLFTYPTLLLRDGFFDTLSISAEDKGRTAMYQDESRRKSTIEQFGDLDDYIASLEITATIHEISEGEIARVAQLTQKTNQFNLTTKRYSEGDIASFAEGEHSAVYSLSVSDKFGKSGLTGVIIATSTGDMVMVDSLLMSCRILGRKLELCFVQHCLDKLAQRFKPREWRASYRRTNKNAQVESFLEQFGFEVVEKSEQEKSYRLEEIRRRALSLPAITIREG